MFEGLTPRPTRILSVDPGSDTLGTAFIEVSDTLGYLGINVSDAGTYKASARCKHRIHVTELRGDRFNRLDWHKANFLALLQQYQPDIVVLEAPFLGKFATSFETLVEVRMALSWALWEYNPNIPLETVEPTTVKAFIGAPTKRKKGQSPQDYKESVRVAMMSQMDVTYNPHVDIAQTDEHTTDAIAVGYWRCWKFIREELRLGFHQR